MAIFARADERDRRAAGRRARSCRRARDVEAMVRVELDRARSAATGRALDRLLAGVAATPRWEAWLRGRVVAPGAAVADHLDDVVSFWSLTAATPGPVVRGAFERDATVPRALQVPVVVMAHMLIADAVRHGFAGGRAGTVAVGLSRRRTGGVSLVVEDDGVSLDRRGPSSRRGGGIAAARALAGRVGGRLELRSYGGWGTVAAVHLSDGGPANRSW